MCQIIAGSAHKVRSTLLNTPGLIADLYQHNSDGLGAMFRSRGGLRIVKALPKNAGEARVMIESLPDDDRNLALHARMTTHGLTDKLNCHPYDVVPGEVALMHNGILHTGNSADRTKSDTWHFIKDYLADMVKTCPAVVHEPQFAKMVGDFIDSNRFVVMDADGKMTIINEDQGLWHDGLWFANTYAWSPELLIPGYRTARPSARWSPMWDDEADNAEDRAYQQWVNDRGDRPTTPTLLTAGRKVDIGGGDTGDTGFTDRYYDGQVVSEYNTGSFDVFVTFDGDAEGYSYMVLDSATAETYDSGFGFDTINEAELEAEAAIQEAEGYDRRSMSARQFLDSDEHAGLGCN